MFEHIKYYFRDTGEMSCVKLLPSQTIVSHIQFATSSIIVFQLWGEIQRKKHWKTRAIHQN